MTKVLTHSEFINLVECHCGKPLFKFTDTCKNICYARCNYTKEEYDIKKRVWVPSKKQPCNFLRMYHGERPVFKEIQKVEEIKPTVREFTLERELKELFSFLMVSNRTSTLDEINILVRTKLKRQPLQKSESYTEYRDRIFSEKIEEIFTQNVKPKRENYKSAGYDYLKSIDHSGFQVTAKKKKRTKKKKQEIDYSYDSLSENSDSESNLNSDSDSDSEYSDEESENSNSECNSDLELNEEDDFIEDNDQVDDYDSAGECDYDD
jgi:hypothetical protein